MPLGIYVNRGLSHLWTNQMCLDNVSQWTLDTSVMKCYFINGWLKARKAFWFRKFTPWKRTRGLCAMPLDFEKKHALEEDLGPVCAMAPGFLNIHALEEDLRHRHAPESSRHVTVTNCVALDQQKSLHRVWSWGVTTRQIADEWPHEWKGTGWPHLQNVWSG